VLGQLIAESKAAGVKPPDAELQIWRLAIRRCKGNVLAIAGWMGVDGQWCRRHLKKLGLYDEVNAARGRQSC
jgi:hypothetical protein